MEIAPLNYGMIASSWRLCIFFLWSMLISASIVISQDDSQEQKLYREERDRNSAAHYSLSLCFQEVRFKKKKKAWCTEHTLVSNVMAVLILVIIDVAGDFYVVFRFPWFGYVCVCVCSVHVLRLITAYLPSSLWSQIICTYTSPPTLTVAVPVIFLSFPLLVLEAT